MHAYQTGMHIWELSEGERLSAASLPYEGHMAPADFYFKAGIALALPLLLALVVELCFAGTTQGY